MLSYKHEVMRPYLTDLTRLALLSRPNHNFGEIRFNDNYVLDHLNHYSERVLDPRLHNVSHSLKHNRNYPDLQRAKIKKSVLSSDILLKDTFRQHSEIESRYRRGLFNLAHIRTISDPSYKYHQAMSRGLERQIVNHINLLDAEMINRKTLQPLII